MNAFKRSLLVLLLPLFAFTAVHKFYLSVTNVEYSEKDLSTTAYHAYFYRRF